MKKIHHANTSQKESGAVILIPDKVDFRERLLPEIQRVVRNDKGISSSR